MYTAVVFICNLLSFECISFEDKLNKALSKEKCLTRTISIEKEILNMYKVPLFVKKECVKLDNFKNI